RFWSFTWQWLPACLSPCLMASSLTWFTVTPRSCATPSKNDEPSRHDRRSKSWHRDYSRGFFYDGKRKRPGKRDAASPRVGGYLRFSKISGHQQRVQDFCRSRRSAGPAFLVRLYVFRSRAAGGGSQLGRSDIILQLAEPTNRQRVPPAQRGRVGASGSKHACRRALSVGR